MEKNRLEAFSDGVLAISITIMVLELKVPHDDSPQALLAPWPVFLCYVLSFLYVGIYWNNHHHLLQAAQKVSGGVLWANMHLLFAVGAYYVLQLRLAAHHGPGHAIARALGRDVKGKASLVVYAAGTAAAWWLDPWLGFAAYAGVALMWLVPDRRMARAALARRTGPSRHET